MLLYFVTKIFPVLALEILSVGSYDCVGLCTCLKKAFPYLPVLYGAPDSPCVLPTWVLEQSFLHGTWATFTD